MIENSRTNAADGDIDSHVIADALRRAAQESLRRHKLLGQPIAIWRDGKAVVIPAEEIQLNQDSPPPRQ